jgi:quercetin dioxygenase-like cupin family protein
MRDKSGTIVRQKDARVLHAFGEEITILLDGERTAGRFTMWTEVTPPGGGPPAHYHSGEDETFHVIAGRLAFLVDGEWNEVGTSGAAFMPHGVIHAFKNIGDQPSRMLITTTPSGIEEFFAQCAAPFAKTDQPDTSRLIEISAQHGIHFVQQSKAVNTSRLQQLCVEINLGAGESG